MRELRILEVPALEIRQGPRRTIYSFAVDGKLLPQFATVDRLGRDQKMRVRGYQRPEVLSHIADIRTYLESPNPMIPNALVIAFDNRVRFEPLPGNREPHGGSRYGKLVIPANTSADDSHKPGWIVDGQQRSAAIRDARIDRFPICVTAFITSDSEEQREQFILVNSTKPLPKGLVYELLPATRAKLPALLHRRRFPATLLEKLNLDTHSPFRRLIQTPTNPGGLVKDNSILRMLENSLTDGALYRFRVSRRGAADVSSILAFVYAYWDAVADTFAEAWALPPRRSRLMHGVGIVTLGFIMDAIADRLAKTRIPSKVQFQADLRPLRDECRWTSGYWDFGPEQQRKWNELQNTSKDIQLLSNHLLSKYKSLVWNQKRAVTK